MKKTLIISLCLMLTSCSHKLTYYKDSQPRADIQAYFNGKIKAWGLIQDWRGRVTTRFDVDMLGSWKGNIGTLEEDFRYYDGRKQRRVWRITKHSDNSYSGTADDIIGKAKGVSEGSGINWHYSMDIPVGDTTYRIKLDDWMWQMNDGVLINRSYLKKFGITVAELTLFMQKQ